MVKASMSLLIVSFICASPSAALTVSPVPLHCRGDSSTTVRYCPVHPPARGSVAGSVEGYGPQSVPRQCPEMLC